MCAFPHWQIVSDLEAAYYLTKCFRYPLHVNWLCGETFCFQGAGFHPAGWVIWGSDSCAEHAPYLGRPSPLGGVAYIPGLPGMGCVRQDQRFTLLHREKTNIVVGSSRWGLEHSVGNGGAERRRTPVATKTNLLISSWGDWYSPLWRCASGGLVL